MNILTNTTENYKRWKDKKLGTFTKNPDELTVHITSPNAISKPEKSMVISLLRIIILSFFTLIVSDRPVKRQLKILLVK